MIRKDIVVERPEGTKIYRQRDQYHAALFKFYMEPSDEIRKNLG